MMIVVSIIRCYLAESSVLLVGVAAIPRGLSNKREIGSWVNGLRRPLVRD